MVVGGCRAEAHRRNVMQRKRRAAQQPVPVEAGVVPMLIIPSFMNIFINMQRHFLMFIGIDSDDD